jgi:hypothetical protein
MSRIRDGRTSIQTTWSRVHSPVTPTIKSINRTTYIVTRSQISMTNVTPQQDKTDALAACGYILRTTGRRDMTGG